MHFARIDRDHVARTGLDRPAPACRFLRAAQDDADAELVVRMPAEAMGGVGFDCLHAFDRTSAHPELARSSSPGTPSIPLAARQRIALAEPVCR